MVFVVTDVTGPIVYCPYGGRYATKLPTDAGTGTAVLTWDEPRPYYENSGDLVNVTCTIPSGYAFPPGYTSGTCSGTDSSGNTGTCIIHVIVYCKSHIQKQ